MSTKIASTTASSLKHKPDDTWLRRGQDIAQRVSHQQWEIGDWLVEGTKKWERKAYDAAERIFPDYNRQALRDLAYVARALETSVRSDVLSWSHHKAVASMKPGKQKELLDYAAQKHLSFAAFRRHLNALEQQRIDAEDAKYREKMTAEEAAQMDDFVNRCKQAAKQAKADSEREWQQREERATRQAAQDIHRPELAKEIIHAGKRALAMKRHPDHGGSNDAMTELNLTVEWLLKIIGESDGV